MLKAITKQFSLSVMANKEKGTLTNHKGGPSSGHTPNMFRKVDAIITLSSGKEIDNHMGIT